MKEYKNRHDVPTKYKFDLTEIYKNKEEWEKTFNIISKEVEKIPGFQGKLKDAKKLEDFLTLYVHLICHIMDLYVYAMLNHDVDLNNEAYIDMLGKIENINTKFNTYCAFFSPEIVNLSKTEYENLFQKNQNLEKYHNWLNDIYQEKEHILTKEEETIINMMQETFQSYEKISSSLINQEHHYGKIKMADGEMISIAANNLGFLKRNPEKSIRKKANKQFGEVIEQYQNTESALLYNYIKNNINLAKLKKYENPWQRKIENIHISNEVFENLKASAKENKNLWQDYYKLMKKVLKLKNLYNYDTLLNWNHSSRTYTIEEAEKIVLDALQPLGEEYNHKLKKVFEKHYIDYCGYIGKVNGGYSCSTYTQDSRIVLTFKGQFSDILTIAHEAGHNVHHQYIKENNYEWYRDTSTFVAEVASLTNEFLVNSYIAEHGNTKEEKLLGLEHSLKTFQNNFFGAVREGEMEQDMYEYVQKGNTITANYLNNLTLKSLKTYQNDIIKDDGYSKLSWVTRSHYYMNFYLFSYALCVVIAAYVASKIMNHDQHILASYQEFLKCGSNMYPEEIYQKLGIDLKDGKVFENGIDFFASLLKQYEKIYKVGE